MTVPDGLGPRLVEFVGALREHGIGAGPGETVDAGAVVGALGLADRDRLRHGLAAALLRRGGQRRVFDQVFDLYFPLGVGAPMDTGEDAPTTGELREQLAEALTTGDQAAMARIAGQAVAAFGEIGDGGSGGSGDGSGGGASAHQTLEALAPQTLIVRVERGMRTGTFTDRLARDEARRRVERFREQVRTEARRRTAEQRGRERIHRFAVDPATERVDFLGANREQLAALRRTVAPLSRKLATRLAARRRAARRGSLDLRRTLRASMSTGGVPMRPVYRKPRPGRPEMVLLCDMSGSVATFATFTLMLVQALRDQFSKVRIFAFVDTTDEVTGLFGGGEAEPSAVAARILGGADVSWSGSSDYGRALRTFLERYSIALTSRTSVLVLGDARSNYGDPNAAAFEEIVHRVRRVHWLNPEGRAWWGTGDSAADVYRELAPMHECRTVEQLTAVVGGLLPV